MQCTTIRCLYMFRAIAWSCRTDASADMEAACRANCNCCEAKVFRCTVVQQAFPIPQFGVTREQKFIADRAAGPAPRSIARGSFSSPTPNRLNEPACARARFAGPVKPKCSSCRIQFQCRFHLSEGTEDDTRNVARCRKHESSNKQHQLYRFSEKCCGKGEDARLGACVTGSRCAGERGDRGDSFSGGMLGTGRLVHERRHLP